MPITKADIRRLLLDVLCDRCEVHGTRFTLNALLDDSAVYTALSFTLLQELLQRWGEARVEATEAAAEDKELEEGTA